MAERLRLRLIRLRRRLVRIYNSIWFFPLSLLVAAIVLFVISSLLDRSELLVTTTDPPDLRSFVVFTGSPSAARTVLSSIATGWATILGVVFSVTLLVVQLTASNYTPQILSQFEKSRVTQSVLGSYVGSVTYALLVLKTVRTGEGGSSPFVPVIGTNLALVWAVIDLLLLVLYIATLISFIRPHRFVDSLTKSTIRAVQATLAPRRRAWLEPYEPPPSEQPGGVASTRERPRMGRREIRADRDGAVSRLDWDALLDALYRQMQRWLRAYRQAESSPWRLHTEKKTGDRVGSGDLLAVIEAPLSHPELNHLARWVQEAFDIEAERRPEEDPVYGLAILSAMGVRAASNGAPQVAIEAVDGLFAVLSRLVDLPLPARHLTGHVDGLRLLIRRPGVDVLQAAVDGVSDVIDAALKKQLSAPVEEASTRAVNLLLKVSRDEPYLLPRLAGDLLPPYQRVLHKLESERALKLIVDQLATLAETLAGEGREAQARIVTDALIHLHAGLQGRPEVQELLQAALDRIASAQTQASSSAGS